MHFLAALLGDDPSGGTPAFHWATLLLGQGVIVLSIIAGYVSSRRKIERVKRLSEPTGNGFAREVLEALQRIENRVDRVEGKIDTHVSAHASAEVQRRR